MCKSPPCVVKLEVGGGGTMISIFSMFIPYPSFLCLEASVSQGVNVAHSSLVPRSMCGNVHTHVSNRRLTEVCGQTESNLP